MLPNVKQLAVMQTNPFPYAVAEDVAGIKNRYFRLIAGEKLTIDIDQNFPVSCITIKIMSAMCH